MVVVRGDAEVTIYDLEFVCFFLEGLNLHGDRSVY